mgnify:FL=1
MWWRMAGNNAWRDTDEAGRHHAFEEIARKLPRPPGLLAYDAVKPVGWVQVTPRDDIPRFNDGRVAKPA